MPSRLVCSFSIEGMATHSNVLTWRIPWTEEPGRLWYIGLRRVRHNGSNLACMHTHRILSKYKIEQGKIYSELTPHCPQQVHRCCQKYWRAFSVGKLTGAGNQRNHMDILITTILYIFLPIFYIVLIMFFITPLIFIFYNLLFLL